MTVDPNILHLIIYMGYLKLNHKKKEKKKEIRRKIFNKQGERELTSIVEKLY